MIDYKKIAYLPVDIPRLIVDEAKIKELVDSNNTYHRTGWWKCLPLIARVSDQKDFYDQTKVHEAWQHRYDKNGEILYNLEVLNELKPLFDHLSKLPLFITYAQILLQVTHIVKHFDMRHNKKFYWDDYPGVNDDVEPACYKILLNNFDSKSFFVSKGFYEPNNYISLPPDTSTFLINEKKFPHGATLPEKPKFILPIFGLINKEAHLKLIDQSIKKYKDYVISY
jgi:hypothetical protein